ncbi:EcsC family protein [Flavobacterium sp. NRK1]|uniref:EcsC family protein n=1 Tax=Flavobacterium sp. NRK1 TaxID=2954929 RepID=UPI002092091F|nr:EcsC family protein [Flavobacterium sp. NRK1]MCO6148432.1 EcsC family protein [Flavobacterium sp. NRK1]
MDLHKIILKVMPPFQDIERNVRKLQFENPGKTQAQLSRLYINKLRNKYASVGAVTALPGIIPGLGTVAQVAVEAGAISTDVAFMLRWMAGICYGISLIYGHDIKDNFEEEFTMVLGLWSGVVIPEKAALAKGDKVSVNHFDKHIAERIKNRMNQKIARKMVTKYGSKRGGAALGTLIPFGIGAIVGGSFNYITLQRFGKYANDYFGGNTTDYIVTD